MSPDVVLSGQRGPRWLFVPAVPSAGQGFGSGIPLGRSSSLLGARLLASVAWATCLPCWDAPAPSAGAGGAHPPGVVSTGVTNTRCPSSREARRGVRGGLWGRLPSLRSVGRLRAPGWARRGSPGARSRAPCPWPAPLGSFLQAQPAGRGSDSARPPSPLAPGGGSTGHASRPPWSAASPGPRSGSWPPQTRSRRFWAACCFRCVTSVAHGFGTGTLSWKTARGPSLAEGTGAEGTAWPAGPPQGAVARSPLQGHGGTHQR